MSKPVIAILILAAGSSSRMDDIKQLLPWKGKPLINHAVEAATGTKAAKVAVVLGANAPLIREAIIGAGSSGVAIYENKNWEQGMGNTIACGMKALSEAGSGLDGVLLMLCDQPLIDANYLVEMIRTFNPHENEIVATRYRHHAGVPALFSRNYFPELLHLHGDTGAKALLARHGKDCIVLDAGNRTMDIDTKEDYEGLQRG